MGLPTVLYAVTTFVVTVTVRLAFAAAAATLLSWLIALDAPPASYMWQVANALDGGATPEDIVGVLKAVAPQVGGPRVVAAAPELMVALGLSLPDAGA